MIGVWGQRCAALTLKQQYDVRLLLHDVGKGAAQVGDGLWPD
jgi:hypothetical protein